MFEDIEPWWLYMFWSHELPLFVLFEDWGFFFDLGTLEWCLICRQACSPQLYGVIIFHRIDIHVQSASTLTLAPGSSCHALRKSCLSCLHGYPIITFWYPMPSVHIWIYIDGLWWFGVSSLHVSQIRESLSRAETILGAILCFILCRTWFLCFVVDWHYGYFPCDYDEKWGHGDSTHGVWWIYTWALVACRPKNKISAFGKNHQTFHPCRFGGLHPLSGEWKFQVPTYTEGLGFSFIFFLF